MRTLVLLFAGMLVGLTTVTAAEQPSAIFAKDLDHTARYRYVQPVTFVERGVEFFVFPDGSFDFNANQIYNGRRNSELFFESHTRRSSINVGLNIPGSFSGHYGSRGVLVTYDRFGNVNRIGNVFLDYDRFGRIARVGSVRISYRHGYLRQVGGMTLQFNAKGRLIHTRGFVNKSNRDRNFHRDFDYDLDNHRHWNDSRFENDDFYYFKQDGVVKKHQKLNSKKRR